MFFYLIHLDFEIQYLLLNDEGLIMSLRTLIVAQSTDKNVVKLYGTYLIIRYTKSIKIPLFKLVFNSLPHDLAYPTSWAVAAFVQRADAGVPFLPTSP